MNPSEFMCTRLPHSITNFPMTTSHIDPESPASVPVRMVQLYEAQKGSLGLGNSFLVYQIIISGKGPPPHG